MSGPNGFWVTGVVVRDAFQGPTYSYATVREGERQYWDVACFEDGPLDLFRSLRSGTEVKVAGHLGKRKMKGNADQQGRDRYEIQLIAERVVVVAMPSLPGPPSPAQGLAPTMPQMTYEQYVQFQAAQQGAKAQNLHAAQQNPQDDGPPF
jgi:single-stranded DNA-binding protein